jgi:hypothetical protein
MQKYKMQLENLNSPIKQNYNPHKNSFSILKRKNSASSQNITLTRHFQTLFFWILYKYKIWRIRIPSKPEFNSIFIDYATCSPPPILLPLLLLLLHLLPSPPPPAAPLPHSSQLIFLMFFQIFLLFFFAIFLMFCFLFFFPIFLLFFPILLLIFVIFIFLFLNIC